MNKPEALPDLAHAVTVGRIVAAHGVKGEVKVEPLSDFPERFQAGSRLWIEGAPHTVERGRTQRRILVIKLRDVDTRSQAEALQGKELVAAEASRLEGEGLYYLHDILGARVEDQAGEALGSVVEVLSTGSNDVYVVRGERGELLLPALDDVILRVDVASKRIVADVPEGIEFAPAQRRRRSERRSASAS
jgi:16S rRNA processing protein RimM